MPTLPKSLFWTRVDVAGAEHAMLDDRRGLLARGALLAVDPVPYTCRYDLCTDEGWATQRLEVSCEGAGWLRTLRLERAVGRWRASTAEQGDLDAVLRAAGRPTAGPPGIEDPERLSAALDVDLGGSPLFNTLPIRRLRLREATPGEAHRITTVWVLVPGLRVIPAQQDYTALDAGTVRYDSANFTADLTVDEGGYVRHYPGLAQRVEPAG